MAEHSIEVDLNLNQNEAKQLVIEQRTDFPASAIVGRIIDRPDLQLYYRCFDASGDTTLITKWKALGSLEKSVFFEAVNFDFNDFGSTNIKLLSLDTRLRRVELIVDVAFNDLSATFQVGISGQDDKYMATNQNLLSDVTEWDVFPNFRLIAAEMIRFTVTPGTSTQGSGTIIIYYSGDQ